MKPFPDQDSVYAEPNGLRISVPLSGFTESSLIVLRQMVESKAPLIRKALGADSLEIIPSKTRLLFPWFLTVPPEEDIHPILVFISALTARARSGKPAPMLKNYESERYTFNNFLTALDLDAPEYQAVRKQLMKNLSGSVPFPDRKTELAHRERAQQRRRNESAVRIPVKEED